MTEQELDELYEEVKKNREMFEKRIADESIREDVERVLESFTSVKDFEVKAQCVEIEFEGSCSSRSGWWTSDERPTICRTIAEMNKEEKKYFESLLNKYCNVVKVNENKWKLTLK